MTVIFDSISPQHVSRAGTQVNIAVRLRAEPPAGCTGLLLTTPVACAPGETVTCHVDWPGSVPSTTALGPVVAGPLLKATTVTHLLCLAPGGYKPGASQVVLWLPAEGLPAQLAFGDQEQ
jgi:hypothetical protein